MFQSPSLLQIIVNNLTTRDMKSALLHDPFRLTIRHHPTVEAFMLRMLEHCIQHSAKSFLSFLINLDLMSYFMVAIDNDNSTMEEKFRIAKCLVQFMRYDRQYQDLVMETPFTTDFKAMLRVLFRCKRW